MANEVWEDIKGSSDIWLPEKVGDAIEGTITEIKNGLYGVQAVIVNGDNEWITPSHKVLQNRISECKVGDYVRITYERDELPSIKGRNPTKIYSVKRRHEAPVKEEVVQ